jgi:hypothetical protein
MKMSSSSLACCLVVLAAFGCAGVKNNATPSGTGGTGNTTGVGGFGAGPQINPCMGTCTDFPSTPVVDGTVPGNPGQIFGAAGQGAAGGPCIIEPQENSLFPNNWLRPRIRFTAGAGLYEIRVHAPNQANDLVVYTTNTSWKMDKMYWVPLALHSRDMQITVTVRSASPSGGQVTISQPTHFTIAPVGASGKMVYWSTSGTTYFNGQPTGSETLLSGFAVGDESVRPVLTPGLVMSQTNDQGNNPRAVKCIGCHTSTPDGEYISFNDFYPWGAALASGASGTVGMRPPYLGTGGYNAIRLPWVGITTFSKAHWADGDRTMVAPLGTCNHTPCINTGIDMDQKPGLAWFNLESAVTVTDPMQLKGQAWDWIYAPVSGQYAAAPSWSHDGTKVLFTMTNVVKSGRLASGTAHLYTVPYSKAGPQTATPVPGDGSVASRAQYYGSYSGDDKLIAYNELDAITATLSHPKRDTTAPGDPEGMYAQPQAEIFVINANGGTKVRFKANDPPECAGQLRSPGVSNSWPKWSPQVETSGLRTFYWVIFSSWREGKTYPTGGPIAQLYLTAVTVDEILTVANYPAIHIWNQPEDKSNHTPAWDIFKIPDVM